MRHCRIVKTPLQQIETLTPTWAQLFSVLVMEIPSLPGDDATDFPNTVPVRIGFRPGIGRWDKPEWQCKATAWLDYEFAKFPYCVTVEISRDTDPHQIAEAVAADLAKQIGGGL